MSDLRFPLWQEPVRLALVETDPDELQDKITLALQAIELRRTELDGDPDHHDERLALEDATNLLKSLRRISGDHQQIERGKFL